MCGVALRIPPLIDGIVAEEFGRSEEARQALEEAAEAGRPALGEEMVPPQLADRFAAAVRTYAQVRLALLLSPSDPEAGQVRREDAGPYAGLATQQSLRVCPSAVVFGRPVRSLAIGWHVGKYPEPPRPAGTCGLCISPMERRTVGAGWPVSLTMCGGGADG